MTPLLPLVASRLGRRRPSPARARDVAGDVDGSLALARHLERRGPLDGAPTPGAPSPPWPPSAASTSPRPARSNRTGMPSPSSTRPAPPPPRARPGASTRPRLPGTSLAATPRGDGGWRLSGVKPWCSLADRVSHALVTAAVDGRTAGAVRRRRCADAGVAVDPARGRRAACATSRRARVTFDDVPADPGRRPGLVPRAARVRLGRHRRGRRLVRRRRGRGRRAVGCRPLPTARPGRPDAPRRVRRRPARHAAHPARRGPRRSTPGGPTASAGRVLAARVRAQAARCAEEVLTTVGHALGPGPLALDPVHAARVADLTLYLRQHHAERDLAALGRPGHRPTPTAPRRGHP